jgi:nitrate/nitrite-specific signal transduction histidine kinase
MRERCRRLNGSLAINNKKGTRIEVRIPLAEMEADLFSLPLFSAPEEP